MIGMCDKDQYNELPIADTYDIIDIYINSLESKKREYKKTHYDKIEIIEKIYKQINEEYPRLQWTANDCYKYKGVNGNTSNIEIYNFYQFIAYNNTNVIICRICPILKT